MFSTDGVKQGSQMDVILLYSLKFSLYRSTRRIKVFFKVRDHCLAFAFAFFLNLFFKVISSCVSFWISPS